MRYYLVLYPKGDTSYSKPVIVLTAPTWDATDEFMNRIGAFEHEHCWPVPALLKHRLPGGVPMLDVNATASIVGKLYAGKDFKVEEYFVGDVVRTSPQPAKPTKPIGMFWFVVLVSLGLVFIHPMLALIVVLCGILIAIVKK